jgi:hypothetical protein
MIEKLNAIFEKIDESFDGKDSAGYDLILEIGDKTFGYSIRDIEKNKYIALGYFRNQRNDILNAHAWMDKPFHSVHGIVANARVTLIPESLYLESEKTSYFNFLHEKEPGEVVLSDKLEHLGIYSVYSIPGNCINELNKKFTNISFCHISSHLIGNIWMTVKNKNGQMVFLNLREEQFDLLAFEGNKLKYSNVFTFQTAEDIAYYVIFVFEQLNLNPEEITLTLSGTIDRFSPVYDVLFRYIRNIDFVSRNEGFNYSYFFKDIPGHFYFSLLNSSSCES